jgi:hypothetical protein
MSQMINDPRIEQDQQDIDDNGPNYFLMGGPNPAYCRKASAELQPATLHLLLS